MAILLKASCTRCKTLIRRSRGRINEGKKFRWKVYCSRYCQGKYRTQRKVFACEYCKKKLVRVPSAISPHNYCSNSCSAKQSNLIAPRYRTQQKICAYNKCKKRFRGENKYCSQQCGKIGRRGYTPEQLLKLLKQTASKMRRTPAKRDVRMLAERCIQAFGTWNKAVVAAHLTPNRSHDHRMYKRVLTKAHDGHVCDSASEAVVDNWLYANGILHGRYHRYPEGNCKADWIITITKNPILVEYFGLANDSQRYDRSIERKRLICRKHNIKLIEIYPWDLYPKMRLKRKLKNKLPNIIKLHE